MPDIDFAIKPAMPHIPSFPVDGKSPVAERVPALPSKDKYTQDSLNISPLEKETVTGLKGIFNGVKDVMRKWTKEDLNFELGLPVKQTMGTDKPRLEPPKLAFPVAPKFGPPPTDYDQAVWDPKDAGLKGSIENMLKQVLIVQDRLGALYLLFNDETLKIRSEMNKSLWDAVQEAKNEAEKMATISEVFKWLGIISTVVALACAVSAFAIFTAGIGALALLPASLQVALAAAGGVASVFSGATQIAGAIISRKMQTFSVEAQKARHLQEMNRKDMDILVNMVADIIASSHKHREQLHQVLKNYYDIMNKTIRGEK